MSHFWTRIDRLKTATFKQLSFKFYYSVKIFFFFCSFPPFDIIKSFKHHKTDLAVNGETVPKQSKTKNPKDKQKTLNKPSSLVSGVLRITRTVNSTPMQCDSLESCWIHTNDTGDCKQRLLLINTARVTLGNFFFF